MPTVQKTTQSKCFILYFTYRTFKRNRDKKPWMCPCQGYGKVCCGDFEKESQCTVTATAEVCKHTHKQHLHTDLCGLYTKLPFGCVLCHCNASPRYLNECQWKPGADLWSAVTIITYSTRKWRETWPLPTARDQYKNPLEINFVEIWQFFTVPDNLKNA